MRLFSSTVPMKMNTGMAISTGLVMMPYMRCDSAPSRPGSNWPDTQPSSANAKPTPNRVKVTG